MSKLKHNYILPLFLLFQILFLKIIAFFPEIVERFYSNGIYPIISKALRTILGPIPFSIGDILYGILIIYCIYWLYKNWKTSWKQKGLAILSFLSLLATGYYFFQLEQTTKIIAFVFLILTMLYTLPFFPNRNNARNWAGVKIYIVTLCWVGVTLFLPIINAGIPIGDDVFLVAVQRFILIFVLILIFEIIDLQVDDPNLKTVPQQIGVKRTKIVGSTLLLLFILLEFLETNFSWSTFLLKIGIVTTTLLFLLFSNERKSKYYSSFFAESIPILWLVLLLIFS